MRAPGPEFVGSEVVTVGIEPVATPVEFFDDFPLPLCAHAGIQLIATGTSRFVFDFAQLSD